jgi:hypothetical protein
MAGKPTYLRDPQEHFKQFDGLLFEAALAGKFKQVQICPGKKGQAFGITSFFYAQQRSEINGASAKAEYKRRP